MGQHCANGKRLDQQGGFPQGTEDLRREASARKQHGGALNGLGLVHNARGLYVQALSCFERALEIIRTEHGPEFSDCATVLRNMAISLQEIGEGRRAEDALEQARQIDRKESSSAR